jgi:hypothetical protein
MSSVLRNAVVYALARDRKELRAPPAALLATAPIFSALAPRASRFCLLTPPLLSLLRRSPFFCFTQTFFLADVTDADVCQIIRECVCIKTLLFGGSKLTGSFIKDAILSSDGGFITRSLELLDFWCVGKSGDALLPLLLPTSGMLPSFLRGMAVNMHWMAEFPRLSADSEMQLLQSSLEALEGRREALWEPALLFIAFLVEKRPDDDSAREPLQLDARVVRRCVAIIEELIDANEFVALLAVELLARLLEHNAALLVPLLLAESDALRGALMLCDRYIERLKRGERAACFLHLGEPRPPLRVIGAATKAVLDVRPTSDVLDLLSYRNTETQRVRTALDVIAAWPKVHEVIPTDGPRVINCRTTLAATCEHADDSDDADGVALTDLDFFALFWPRPFSCSIDGSAPAQQQQQLLVLIADQAQLAFRKCDRIAAAPSSSTDNDVISNVLSNAFFDVEPCLRLVGKGNAEERDIYERANAHLSARRRAFDRVRLFNFVMSIRRRECGSDAEESREAAAARTHTFARLLTVLLRASHDFDDTCGAAHATCFLCSALQDCRVLRSVPGSLSDENDEDDDDDEQANATVTAASRQHRRQRSDDEQQPDEERMRFRCDAEAAANTGLEHVAEVLQSPDVARALVWLAKEQPHFKYFCDFMLDFAVERGRLSSEELGAIRDALAD